MAEFVRLPDVAMVALRANAETAAASGLDRQPGAVRTRNGATVVTISPDEWLLIGTDEDPAALLAPYDRQSGFVAVDVSGNRVGYALRGPDAPAVLARACAIDLAALASSGAAATTVARTQAIVLCDDAETYRLLPRRSFAAYLESWFDAARS